VAGKTREGRVLKTLLDKLDRIVADSGQPGLFDGQQFGGAVEGES
jgi:hypothetical protein